MGMAGYTNAMNAHIDAIKETDSKNISMGFMANRRILSVTNVVFQPVGGEVGCL